MTLSWKQSYPTEAVYNVHNIISIKVINVDEFISNYECSWL